MTVAAWFWYAVIAAVLYGAHQIFTRMAADHIGEGLGGFVVEATAALSILVYLAFLWIANRWDQNRVQTELFILCLLVSALAQEQSYFFYSSKKGGRSLPFLPFWREARQSWLWLGFCFFTKRHPGSKSSVSCLPSSVCFCCAHRIEVSLDLITTDFCLL